MRGPYRVIQWATGTVGREALRAILMHPALELAGVLVHSAEKTGRDAGELCDAPATGVLATNDPDAILACDADCVVYAPTFDKHTFIRELHAVAETFSIR